MIEHAFQCSSILQADCRIDETIIWQAGNYNEITITILTARRPIYSTDITMQLTMSLVIYWQELCFILWRV